MISGLPRLAKRTWSCKPGSSVECRLCCKTILRIRARKIDSRSGAKAQTLVQESLRSDSIVAYFYSTASPRRLLQQNRHQAADLPSPHDHVRLARRNGNHLNVLR